MLPVPSFPSICYSDTPLDTDETSTIQCPTDVPVEYSGSAVVLTSPLAAGASIVCTGTYTLTTQDIDNLLCSSLGTVTANDRYDFEVEASVTETVTLEQASKRDKPLNISKDYLVVSYTYVVPR